MDEINKLTETVIGLAMKVHTALGPGLLESAYEACLTYELTKNKIDHRQQIKLPIIYDGQKIEPAYRLDILIPDQLIVECKAIEKVQSIHKQQLTSYLKLSNISVGLLINFNVSRLKDGITRTVNNYTPGLCD